MTTSVSKPFAINIGEKGVVSKAYVVEGIPEFIPPGGQTFGNMAASHDTRGHVAVTECKTRTNCTDRIIIFFIDEENDDGTTLNDNRFVGSLEMDETTERSKEPGGLHDLVITVRRTSRSVTNIPISYEIIDKKDAIAEQKNNATKENSNSKCSSSSLRAANTATSHDSCFIQLNNLNLLTDYHALVFAQVKLGIMNVNDLAVCSKNAPSCKEGVRGMRCGHCGDEKGSYFPKRAKNVQPVLLQLREHLLKRPCCPADIKRALKMTKAKFECQAVDKPKLWDRIQNGTFDGGDEALAVHLNRIVQECAPKARASSNHYVETNAWGGNVALSAPYAVVNCDEDKLPKSQDMAESPLPLGARSDDHEGIGTCSDNTFSLGFTPRQGIDADDDFGEALSLLQQEPTPCSKFISEPAESVNITPQPIRRAPRGKNQIISYRQEPDHNDNAKLFESEEEAQWRTTDNKKRKTVTHDNTLTRKLTMNDDILLIRGILRYGKKWKTIRDNEPRLHHILHSALKDRTRSKRFQAKLLKAEADPTILDRPHELYEGANQVQGRSDETSANCDKGYGSEDSHSSNTVAATMPPLYSSTIRKNYLRQAVSEFHLPLEVALDPLFLLGDT